MLYLSFFKLNDLKWPPHSLWPSSAENHFNIFALCGALQTHFHRRGPQRRTALLLVPFGNSCAAVCETIPATTLFVKTYFENDRSRFQNTNQKIYSYKYAQSSAEGI